MLNNFLKWAFYKTTITSVTSPYLTYYGLFILFPKQNEFISFIHIQNYILTWQVPRCRGSFWILFPIWSSYPCAFSCALYHSRSFVLMISTDVRNLPQDCTTCLFVCTIGFFLFKFYKNTLINTSIGKS